MAYLYLDFDYSVENNRLTEVDIKIETTNYFDPSIDTFNINQNGYTPMKGDKLYFLPGVNIPRIKLKDLATKFGIRTVRDVSEATILFGSKTLGEIELERKATGTLSIKGNFMAGSLTYDGPIIMQGSITSPSWTQKFKTNIHLTKGDFKFINPLENKYKIENGANIIVDNGNVVVGNIYGRKYRVEDKDGRVGIFKIQEHRTFVSALNGKIIAEDIVNTVSLDADTIIILNAEQDSIISAREILFYGAKLTFDCIIKLKENGSIRFFEDFSIQGLSGDAIIELENGKKIRLFDLKTKKIKDLPDEFISNKENYSKDATLVGNGFTITYDILNNISKKQITKQKTDQ